MGDYFGDFTQAVLRSAIVVAILFPIAKYKKQITKIYWAKHYKYFVGIFIATILINAPLYYAIQKAGIGLGIGVSYAGIVIGAFFFGYLVGKEKYTLDKFIATLLGIAGLTIIFIPNVETFGFLAMVAALVSGLAAGLCVVLNKNMPYNATQTTVTTWAITIVSNIIFIFIFNESVPKVQVDIHWLYLFIFAITSLIASWMVISGVKLIDAGAAGILGLLEIVFGVLFGMLFFDEELTLMISVGMALIVFAAAIPYFLEYRISKLDNTD